MGYYRVRFGSLIKINLNYMFTAEIISKVVESNGVLALTVEFSDGEKVVSTEVCKPQDEDGFNYWLKARLTSLETGAKLKEDDNLNQVITKDSIDTKVDADPERTAWFEKLNRLNRIRTFGIDAGILSGEEREITEIVEDLKKTYKPEYVTTF